MKTSLSALTGKRCGPEMSDPADIKYNSFQSWPENPKFRKQFTTHWRTHSAASVCILDLVPHFAQGLNFLLI